MVELIGTESRTIETVSGTVNWPEPKAYLPKSRKTFFRWITWIWQGEVVRVMAELAMRGVELGTPPPPDAAETDPRQIAAKTLNDLTNPQSHMNYPSYRQAGIPITSSHIESAMKQINQRVKGSEKFWTESGGEALPQLRADQL